MADRKISDLPVNSNPGADTASVPLIETATVNGVTTNTNYRATVRNIVSAAVSAGAVNLDSLSDVDAPSPSANSVLSYVSGAWRARNEDALVDGGNF